MTDFQIPRNRLLPLLTATLSDESGVLNLSGASGVKFQMRAPGSNTLKIDAAADIVTPATGEVRYTWATGNTDTSGLYLGWFEVTTATKTFAVPEPPMVIEVTRGALGVG
jgi:hypothetical protein